MFLILRKLSTNLFSLNLNDDAIAVQTLMKKAVKPRPQQELQIFQNPQYREMLLKILQNIGLKPNQENMIDFLQSIEFLKEGITQNNLLLSGFNLISLIPGFEGIKKLIQNSQLERDIDSALELAYLINKNQGTIQGVLNKIKQEDIAKLIQQTIPNGELLISYSDRIWSEIRTWSFKTISISENQIQNEQVLNEI